MGLPVCASIMALVLGMGLAADEGRLHVAPGMFDTIQVSEPYVWPPPRQAVFGSASIPLVEDSGRRSLIVLGDRAGPKAQIGAADVSARVAQLNLLAVNLPLRRCRQVRPTDLQGLNPILIGTLQDNPLLRWVCARHRISPGTVTPGPEGYLIRVVPWGRGQRAIVVAGYDDQGTLYGCYALSQLLRGHGRTVTALEASVTDWPGFRWRPTGWGNEAYHERNKQDVMEYADLLARLRFNVTCGGGAAVPAVTEYARARGLLMTDGYWSMQGFAEYAQQHITRRCAPGGSAANCWSDPGLRARIQEVFGNVAATAAGISWHDNTDAGWWTPYLQFWNQRCELCRETYPEPDPRRADADRFCTIYDSVKAHGRDKLVLLTLPCYYDDPERFPQMIEYLHYLRDHIPRDIVFYLEDRGPAEAASYEKHLERDCINYLYPDTGPAGRTWAEDFVRVADNRGAVAGCWYNIGHRPDELLTMMASAYQWNPDLPTDMGFVHRVLVPRACHFLYGDAWPQMAEVYLQNVDPWVADNSLDPCALADTLQRARRCQELMRQALPRLGGQARITAQALQARFDQVVLCAERRLAYVRPLQALRRALEHIRDGNLNQAQQVLLEAERDLQGIPERVRTQPAMARKVRYLGLDLQRLRERVQRGEVQLEPRAPRWQIGQFDNLVDEFTGPAGAKLSEFPVGAPLERFPAEGGYTLVFEDALPDGGRLVLRVEGSPITLALDGQELYYTYHLEAGYNDVTVPLPPLPAGTHRLTVSPEGRLRTDAVALYPGQQLVPTTAANEWLLDTSGRWDFRTDPADQGEKEEWFRKPVDPTTWTTISVPSYWETDPRFSGYDGVAWYHTSVKLPWEHHTRPVVLRFGGVDDYAKVWVAGNYVGKHDQEDSEFAWFDEPFEFDVSGKIPFADGADIMVRVEDTHGDGGIFRPVTIAIILGGKDTAGVVGPGALGF